VKVTGKVSQAGRPVAGVTVVLQPLGDGHLRECPLRNDGTFSCELVSGEYAYFVTRPATGATSQPPTKLPHKYFEADLSRTVTVEPDKLLAIALE
jgi:hypothetical protein